MCSVRPCHQQQTTDLYAWHLRTSSTTSMQLPVYTKPTETICATFQKWFVPLGWGATRSSGLLAFAATYHT